MKRPLSLLLALALGTQLFTAGAAAVSSGVTYQAAAVNDTFFARQWALENDGSFSLSPRENDFPVYDDPFGTPENPGEWSPDSVQGQASRSRGLLTQAVAGIDINAAAAWASYQGKRETIVALIDTGVDLSHRDLSGHIWVNKGEIPNNGIDDDGNGYIDDVNGWNFYHDNNQIYTGAEDSHGTHGAGTMIASADNGAGIAGIARGDSIQLIPLKALGGAGGYGTTQSIIEAIQYAERNGAVICNLSLGTERNDRALYEAIATSKMLFVVAAGNDGANTDFTPCYPASYALDNIISVANLNYDGTLHYTSDYGASSVDLAAPGSYILSTTPNNSYSYMTGTSMAAPMVTAAAAMVYSNSSTLSLAAVKEILLATARPLDSLKGKTVTGGMLDLAAALACDPAQYAGAAWAAPDLTAFGSAPVISVKLQTQCGVQYLVVQVSDPDGDLDVTSYATGVHTAEEFSTGAAGKQFALNRYGMAVFTVRQAGTYTFYAADSGGNETVKSVRMIRS